MTVDSIAGVLLVAVAGRLDVSACRQLRREPCSRPHAPAARSWSTCPARRTAQRAIDALVTARERLGVRLRIVVPRDAPAFAALRSAGVRHTLTIHSLAVRAQRGA